jgi:hypothetical protein
VTTNKTNSDGGFSDTVQLEDLKNGNYKIYFGDDTDEDTKFDVGAPTTNVDLTIPCPKIIFFKSDSITNQNYTRLVTKFISVSNYLNGR